VLVEYERTVSAVTALGEILQQKQALAAELELRLDEMTRPERRPVELPPVPSDPGAAVQPRRRQPRGYFFRGCFIRKFSQTSVYVGLLRTLFEELPDKQDAMASAMALHRYSRTYVSRNRATLFRGKTDAWIDSHSVSLVDGWYADTQLGSTQKRRNIQRAVEAAGLRMGEDVTVFWDTH
jgi:hypothetical protein